MPALETFCFDGYTLRPAGEGDVRLATEWTQGDPYHRNNTHPTFWLEQRRGSDSYVLEDNAGPVFFFKMMRTSEAHVVELHIQFPPPEYHLRQQKLRNSRQMVALILGFEWIERVLLFSGVTNVFFISHSPSLIRFCVKRLGFEQKGAHLTKRIAVPGKGNEVCAELAHSSKH
jgi:hypothetical protein